jgi:8-oxo-dGTP pyrophosphatase MutT (NUDIX family)
VSRSPTLGRDVAAARIAGFARRAVDRPDLRHAGVAVCVTEDGGRECLLVTRRAARLRAHAGQWALPGGRIEAGESAVDGALRELREEVGLVLRPDAVLGLLDDYVTRSGYVITPVVCWAGPPGELVAAESEVAAIHQVPLDDLDVPPRFVRIPESEAPVVQLPLLGGLVHAPTAAIVFQFCQVARHGIPTRVAHLEQPVFAWR